jgi:hypothetical protein
MSAATCTARLAVLEPSVPTATVEIMRASIFGRGVPVHRPAHS